MCDGFCAVDVAASPKLHLRELIVPSTSVLASVNEAVRPEVVNWKLAVGGWLVPPLW